MSASSTAVDYGFETKSTTRATSEFPMHCITSAADFAEIAKNVFFPVMPKNGLVEDEREWHLVDQGFQRGRRLAGPRKVGMHPSPKVAVPVSAVVALNSEAERISAKDLAIENDLTRKCGIRVRRSRETNPSFIAQGYAKG